MPISHFEEIIAWQKARELTKLIYKIFGNQKDFGFRDQIQRASVSIMNNIAEGFEREGDKEFARFLGIAKGSAGEVRSMLYIAKDLGTITAADFDQCYGLSLEIARVIQGLMKSLR